MRNFLVLPVVHTALHVVEGGDCEPGNIDSNLLQLSSYNI